MYSLLVPTHLVFQAFRRTMALSHGDVDEAVLFAKVVENLSMALHYLSFICGLLWSLLLVLTFNVITVKCYALIIESIQRKLLLFLIRTRLSDWLTFSIIHSIDNCWLRCIYSLRITQKIISSVVLDHYMHTRKQITQRKQGYEGNLSGFSATPWLLK